MKPKRTRHGQYADGKTKISVVLDEEIRDALQRMSDAERRTLSQYVALHLERIIAERQAAEKRAAKPSSGK